MLKALADTEFGSDFIADSSGGETESGAFLGDFVVEFSAVLGLKSVGLFDGSLVDGGSQFTSFGLSLSGADDNVEGEHVVDVELVLISLLVEGLLVDDDVIPVNQKLLQVVRQNTLHWVAFIAFDGLSDKAGNVVVFISGFQTIESHLQSFVSRQNGIGLASLGGFVANDNCVGNQRNISIDVNTEINFGNIAVLEGVELFLFIIGVGFEGGVVSADLVDRDASGEGDTFFEFFLIVNS